MSVGPGTVVFALLVIAFGCDGAIMRRHGRSVEGQQSALAETIDNLGSHLGSGPHVSSIIRHNAGIAETPPADEGRLGPLPIDIEQIKKIATLLGIIGNTIIPALLQPSGSTNAVEFA